MDIATVLIKKFNAQWTLDGDNYEGLIWLDDSNKPTKKELEDLWTIVEKEMADEKASKAAAKAALLDRLGITQAEAKLLLS